MAVILAAAAAAVLLVQIHRKEKERLALGWAGYGAHILGLEPGGPGRKEYLDRLRFLAAVLVILVHSMEGAASGIFAGQADVPFSAPPVSWYVLTGLSGVGLCCNLLFVMISGARLLPPGVCGNLLPETVFQGADPSGALLCVLSAPLRAGVFFFAGIHRERIKNRAFRAGGAGPSFLAGLCDDGTLYRGALSALPV